jgi:hypothetical protein
LPSLRQRCFIGIFNGNAIMYQMHNAQTASTSTMRVFSVHKGQREKERERAKRHYERTMHECMCI